MKLNAQISSPTMPNNLPVVLLHGLFGKQDNLNQLKQYLLADYKVISVDLRNHGMSEWHQDMDYKVMSQDLLGLLTELNLEKVHLLGHSMGGKVAMATALLAPEKISSLMVADIAPVNYLQDRHSAVFSALRQVASSPAITSRREADILMSKMLPEPAVRQFLLKSFDSTRSSRWQFNLDALQAHYSEIMGWNYTSQLKYTGPVLFIKGGASNYLQSEHHNAIKEHFPNAKAQIIPGAGHWLHAEKPAIFNGIIKRFLEQQL